MKKSAASFLCALLLLAGVVSNKPVFASPLFSVTIPQNETCLSYTAESPFAVSLIPDLVMGGVGLGLTATSLVMDHQNNYPDWDGVLYNKNDVNAFDSLAMFPYSKPLHLVSTATCALNLASPAAVFLFEAACGNLPGKDLLNVGIMYAESFLLSYGIKDLLKATVLRVRPYMYFDGYPEGKIDNHDFEMSFPSGHTTNAFLGAGFLSYVFCEYYPDSTWKVPVVAASYTVAVATAVMRVLGGNHFMTDVIAGSLIGTVCGIGVPLIHHLMASKNGGSSAGDNVERKAFSSAVSPYGVSFTVRF